MIDVILFHVYDTTYQCFQISNHLALNEIFEWINIPIPLLCLEYTSKQPINPYVSIGSWYPYSILVVQVFDAKTNYF